MRIDEIWRYPVKTMAGEKLQRVAVGDDVQLVRGRARIGSDAG